jgi:hypothetical protein
MEVESVNYKPARTKYGTIECSVVVDDDLSELETARLTKLVVDAISRAPLSKYGLDAQVDVVNVAGASTKFGDRELSVYTKGRTWFADFTLAGVGLEEWIRESGTPTVVPIISPLHVRQSLEESL